MSFSTEFYNKVKSLTLAFSGNLSMEKIILFPPPPTSLGSRTCTLLLATGVKPAYIIERLRSIACEYYCTAESDEMDLLSA